MTLRCFSCWKNRKCIGEWCACTCPGAGGAPSFAPVDWGRTAADGLSGASPSPDSGASPTIFCPQLADCLPEDAPGAIGSQPGTCHPLFSVRLTPSPSARTDTVIGKEALTARKLCTKLAAI